MKNLRLAVAMGLFAFPAALPAQVPWDAPLMVGPSTPSGWGVFLSDPSEGSGIGVFTTWRPEDTFGFRMGLAEDFSDDLAVFGGMDVSGELLRVTEDFPLDVSWVVGAGFGIGDFTVLSFPFGASIGRELFADNVRFTPYVTPRVILDAYLGDDRPRDALDLEFAFDLGFDVAFESGWTIRFGGSVGDREALAIGINFQVF
ncbi:MAG: hypothetical protein WEG36_06780 [Gemmatimonadota bacterium]